MAATLALFSRRWHLSPYAPDEIEDEVARALRWKYAWLVAALTLLLLSLGWLVAAAPNAPIPNLPISQSTIPVLYSSQADEREKSEP